MCTCLFTDWKGEMHIIYPHDEKSNGNSDREVLEQKCSGLPSCTLSCHENDNEHTSHTSTASSSLPHIILLCILPSIGSILNPHVHNLVSVPAPPIVRQTVKQHHYSLLLSVCLFMVEFVSLFVCLFLSRLRTSMWRWNGSLQAGVSWVLLWFSSAQ